MKCSCGNEINFQMNANIKTKNCKMFTAPITILTLRCDKCSRIIQFPIQSRIQSRPAEQGSKEKKEKIEYIG